ncbi:MAG: hypothetical protein K0S94_2722 [Nitrospira sp.]|jgi:hypothetical protein|nr:hypothetical protein [Nitrospira sp.]
MPNFFAVQRSPQGRGQRDGDETTAEEETHDQTQTSQ